MNVKNEKKALAFSIIGVITLIAVVVGATYAYFTAQGGNAVNTNVNVTTATTDNLSFQTGESISLTANQEDFGQGSGNKSGETFARATLTANNATNSATRNYYVYLDITSNNFEYTTVDEQAELLLKVTNPDGTEVTTLGSLERKTSGSGANQVTGFDITTSTGLITIADNYEIVSTGTETQEWQVEVIFANLDSDQNANTGKSFSANLIIQEEQTLGNFARYITYQIYTGTDGDNGLYYHDGTGSYTNADQEAGDNSYRFSGANPNNYVCFGSDEAMCPADNLYRIIGVFDGQVKLIKSTSYGVLTWNVNNLNSWSDSDINHNLNTVFLNSLNKWNLLISKMNWQIGGNSFQFLRNSSIKIAYNYELGFESQKEIVNNYIGLMYVSDYGYAAAPDYWDVILYNYNNAINSNWLYLGIYEWTITRQTDNAYNVFFLNSNGIVSGSTASAGSNYRPVFYLNSEVELHSGTGTITDPFILKVN